MCFGAGKPVLALGALVLFLSNVAAIIVLVIAEYGYSARNATARWRFRVSLVLSVTVIILAIPITLNSLAILWTGQIRTATQEWAKNTPDTSVEKVTWQGNTVVVKVLTPRKLPDVEKLQKSLDALIPVNSKVTVVHTFGSRIEN